ncbi:MAG TPA: hypothetical protein VHW04_09340 [Solirubrobacteraceae bacterium]|nr:hypothetical protein [Solirubrobacteraceae bacterium]
MLTGVVLGVDGCVGAALADEPLDAGVLDVLGADGVVVGVACVLGADGALGADGLVVGVA